MKKYTISAIVLAFLNLFLLTGCQLFEDAVSNIEKEVDHYLKVLPGIWQINELYYSLGASDSVVTNPKMQIFFSTGCIQGKHIGTSELCRDGAIIGPNGATYGFDFEVTAGASPPYGINFYMKDFHNPLSFAVHSVLFEKQGDRLTLHPYSRRPDQRMPRPYKILLERVR